uniref:Uncharacterized protein n=1 Tax=Glossina brevipalpis TaxID=37001 RepID=A0A1A9WQ34_9MUSC
MKSEKEKSHHHHHHRRHLTWAELAGNKNELSSQNVTRFRAILLAWESVPFWSKCHFEQIIAI